MESQAASGNNMALIKKPLHKGYLVTGKIKLTGVGQLGWGLGGGVMASSHHS